MNQSSICPILDKIKEFNIRSDELIQQMNVQKLKNQRDFEDSAYKIGKQIETQKQKYEKLNSRWKAS